ncbi:ankyrin repeat-containing domain protein [Tricharina praecox]|uniref:ankyrin repeat-containing domain protein n=1 Tax=Tricharina praecox TaxID=43433 RepID=UPI002220CD0D|nr:ankyrin repeat-containing domain protein [Tricharina praecox]KAI5856990.1 ankyrin repeat-containing domain protein [Tricharina praecox]
MLIEHGADINYASYNNGQTPLFRAAAARTTDALALFIEKGANVNATDFCKATALHEAASSGRIPAIEMLIKNFASVDAKDREKQTPLYYAVEHGQEDVVRKLLEHGADINIKDRVGMSPLSRACAQCAVHINVDMVQLLIENGADVRSKDEDGMTPLHHACREGHEEVVRRLLKAGASAKAMDKRGENALAVAWSFQKLNIVNLLRMNMGMIAC